MRLLSCDVKDLEKVAAEAIGLPAIYENGELLAPYGDAIADAYLADKCKGTSAGRE